MTHLQVGDTVRLSVEYDHWYSKRHNNFMSAGDTGGKWKVRQVHRNGSVTVAQRGAVRPFVPRKFVIVAKEDVRG